jgi:hypothetical protein
MKRLVPSGTRPNAHYPRTMAKSSPADLAVAFRSLPRRLNEAMAAARDANATSAADGHAARLAALVDKAAGLLHVESGRDLGATVEAIATKLHDTDPERWDEAALDEVRAIALDAGAAIRSIEDLAR